MSDNNITYFGLTSFRNQRKKFGIKVDDRRRHFYVIGKTGMGKSNMMENMAIQDIQAGRGIAYIDPHGEGAEKLLDFIPSFRINDVVYFNPADLDYPIAFNVMEKVDFRYRHLVAGGLMSVFKKVWPDVWSARMEYILNNAILALLEYPDATLLGVNRMLADPDFREKVVSKITDPIVKSFWTVEFAKYSQRYEQEATAAIQNKVGQFISNPLIRNIIGQVKSTIDMRDIMDKEKIFIMNLSKGRIGEDNSRLLGQLLITKLQLSAMSRVDVLEADRRDFYLYVDEFQNFATESFASILSEARKYRLNLILGHQYISQMEEEIRDAVFGNVGTLAVFRVGAEDAEFLEKEFSPEFMATDLVNLAKYNIYIKLMIDGVASHPFSAETLAPPALPEEVNTHKIIKASQERYGVKREIVNEKIQRWSEFGAETKDSKNILPQNNALPVKKPMSQLPDGQNQLYDAVCANCGKKAKVVFEPTKDKPVYCKSCYKKMKEAKEKNQAQKTFDHNNHNIDKRNSFSHNQEAVKPKQQNQTRKEINLSDLRKALQDSLEKEKINEQNKKLDQEQNIEQKQNQNQEQKFDVETKKTQNILSVPEEVRLLENKYDPDQELKKRIEAEILEDKVMKEQELDKDLEDDKKNKGIINPGQTIKF